MGRSCRGTFCAECSRSTFSQEIIDILRVRVVLVGKLRTVASPVYCTERIEEQGSVAAAVEWYFLQVVVYVFDILFRQNRQVVAVEAHRSRIAKSHVGKS